MNGKLRNYSINFKLLIGLHRDMYLFTLQCSLFYKKVIMIFHNSQDIQLYSFYNGLSGT